jgi:hypothetical protein
MKSTRYILIAIVLILSFSACEKYNEINNIGTVKTPYVLYVGGLTGSLHKTNDGIYFDRLFPVDNSAVRQVITADTNLLYLKQNCYLSDDEGKAFNIVNNHARDYVDYFNNYYQPSQMLYDASSKIVYLCTKTGLEKSTDFGRTFVPESNFAAGASLNPVSIIEVDKGDLYAIQDATKISKLTGGTGNWTAVAQTTALPSTNPSIWYLSKSKDTVVAADFDGVDGVYYSVDGGDWKKYSGLVGNGRNILFANQPFGSNNLFVGRDSAGLFKANGVSFVPKSTGIPWYARIQYVEGKRVIYRTDVAKYYLFCATDIGLYISESDGDDWRKVREGNFSTLK